MAFFANYQPTLVGVYDNEISITHFQPNNNGKFIGRDSIENAHHSGGYPVFHPTLSNVIKNTVGHVYTHGTYEIVFEWPDGGVTEQEIDQYIALVDSYNLPAGRWDISKTDNPNIIKVNITNTMPQILEWSPNMIGGVEWIPGASKITLYNRSDESEFVCVTRLEDLYSVYSYDCRTVEPNEQYTIDRPESEKCFIVFSEDVSTEAKQLNRFKAYKLTSPTLNITNTSERRVLVMRYYRDALS